MSWEVPIAAGVAGNAYSLFAAHECTGERWMKEAGVRFAEMAVSSEAPSWDEPDHPRSLYEGLAGLICLLAQVLAGQERALMPFFETIS